MCTQILEHGLRSCIIFTDEENFHISGHVTRPKCVIWDSEPPREHLEHEQDTQNYWVFGLFPLSGVLENRKHGISETGSVSVLK
jgi:hypothetical protein